MVAPAILPDVPPQPLDATSCKKYGGVTVTSKPKLLLDLYKVHGNDGDVYTMWNIADIPKTKDEQKKLVASLEASKKLRHKIVIRESQFPTEGMPLKATLISSGIMSTAMNINGLEVVKRRDYNEYTLFEIDSGLAYCIRRNEAN